jgi:hypothetical protein
MRPNLSASSIAAVLATLTVGGASALACGGAPSPVNANEVASPTGGANGQASCSGNASCSASAHKNPPAGHASCSAAAHCGAGAHGDAGK